MHLLNEASASGLLLHKPIYEKDYNNPRHLFSLDLLQTHQKTAASLLLETSLLLDQFKPAHASPSSTSSWSASPIPAPEQGISESGQSSSQSVKQSPSIPDSFLTTANKTEPSVYFGSDNHPMSGPYYQFESSSLPHSSEYATTLPSSSPALGVHSPFQNMKAEAASPVPPFSSHQQAWHNDGQVEQENRMQSLAQASYQFPYSMHKDGVQSVMHETSPVTLQAQGQDASASHYLHRASISGPVMDSISYHNGRPEQMAAPAPPRVHGLAAWENASGSARPHTADGLFGHFGFVSSGRTQDSVVEDTAMPPSVGQISRPYTPAGPSASMEAFFQQRRFSLPDSDAMGGSGNASKIFSYMPPMDDGTMGDTSGTGGAGYGNHFFGINNGFHSNSSKKRPRRRYDEIERLYSCSWPGCNKSYGTLNHLNAHVAMQKHGPKRAPTEFKDMRKAWRKQKKDDEQRRQGRHGLLLEHGLGRNDMTQPSASSTFGHATTVGPNALASAAIAGPPSLSGIGSSVGLPSSSVSAEFPNHNSFGAQLSGYRMSSVAEAPVPPSQPSFFHNHIQGFSQQHPQQQHQQQQHYQHFPAGASSHVIPNAHDQELSNFAPVASESRPNTTVGHNVMESQAYPHQDAAGYLSAHRGSI